MRQERSGYHFFNRDTGCHILISEFLPTEEQWSAVPRVLSVALTNACDLHCYFCYAPKHVARLPYDYTRNIATCFWQSGGQEIVLGGGEPTLYPRFAELIRDIHDSTRLAVGFTTHGHHLQPSLLEQIWPLVSRIRISIDALEPEYSRIRGKPLKAISNLLAEHELKDKFAVNAVILPGRVRQTAEVLEFALDHGIREVLLIPVHSKGLSLLSVNDESQVRQLVHEWRTKLRINVSSNFRSLGEFPILQTSEPGELLFAHLSADKHLRLNSYESGGIPVPNPQRLSSACNMLYSNEDSQK